MLLLPTAVGAQALPFTVADTDPVILAKGGAGLTETGSVSYAAFTNPAAITFSDSKLDAAAGYVMWQPSAAASNVISAGAAYNLNNKLGFAAGLYYGLNGQNMPMDVHAAVGVSYRFLDFMSAGINLGYASSLFPGGQSYDSFAGDAFIMAKLYGVKVTAGVSNVFGAIRSASGAKFSIPGSLAVGVGYGTTFADVHAVEANVDFDYFFSGPVAASVGAEYTFNNMVSGRVGYRYGGESPIPSYISVGVGGKFKGFKLDLSYLIAESDSPMRNTLSVGLGYSF